MVGGRRWRRMARGARTLLPLQRAGAQITHTVSCWYCDFKITTFNNFLCSLGCRHARLLRAWYAAGVCFTIITFVGVTLTLLHDLVRTVHGGSYISLNLTSFCLPGVDQFSGLSLSIVDILIMIYSTLSAVIVHEFGHALAAASQGIQVEYVAIFIACIFPGAFVAFNYDVLLNSSLMTALRVYCAGIWHNAVLCAICALMLFSIPTVLHPLYLYGESPMVLDVAIVSPLYGYLSQGDFIISLDGTIIHNPQQWRDKLVKIGGQNLNTSANSVFNSRKGYCVPDSWLNGKDTFQNKDNSSCSEEQVKFMILSCSMSSSLWPDVMVALSNTAEQTYCLRARDIVKLQKCGDGWESADNQRICSCLEDESCMMPVQSHEQKWIEVSIERPHSPDCLNFQSIRPLPNHNASISQSPACRRTFVFIGDVASLLGTVVLSAYRPRHIRGLSLYFPNFLEKIITCMLQASASLALFNSLPALFLDGESILEACILSIACLRLRWRRRLTKIFLYGGTLLVVCMLVQILFLLLRKPF